jgi:ring-1,2-phenylacetyl-CoA epoxidase subunit PaaC
MFHSDAVDVAAVAAGIGPDPSSLRPGFDAIVTAALVEATLVKPDSDFAHKGGRTGAMHTEHLGHMLCQMQWLQRAYPGNKW